MTHQNGTVTCWQILYRASFYIGHTNSGSTYTSLSIGWWIMLENFFNQNIMFLIVCSSFCFCLQNRYSHMLPYLVLAWIGLVICVIILISIPIDWFGSGYLKRFFINVLHPKTEDERRTAEAFLGFLYCVAWISFAISAGLFCFEYVFSNFFTK